MKTSDVLIIIGFGIFGCLFFYAVGGFLYSLYGLSSRGFIIALLIILAIILITLGFLLEPKNKKVKP